MVCSIFSLWWRQPPVISFARLRLVGVPRTRVRKTADGEYALLPALPALPCPVLFLFGRRGFIHGPSADRAVLRCRVHRLHLQVLLMP